MLAKRLAYSDELQATAMEVSYLIALICTLWQTMWAKRLAYSDELQATAMEVMKWVTW